MVLVRRFSIVLLGFASSAVASASPASASVQTLAQTSAQVAEPKPLTLHFAVIGDYGMDGPPESAVAGLVAGWNPEIVITLGDNNYLLGEQSTIDAHIGQYYSAFIHPYVGIYGPGATENRFFPSLGNHDWYTTGAAPYLAYFTLPGNERYYDFVRGPIHFFAVDSDPNEPDGITGTSVQALWLKNALAHSTSPFNFVYFHHAAYSSSASHGSTPDLQWPFREWGADAVLNGHDHDYERIVRDGFPYVVCGVSGFPTLYGFIPTPLAGSAVRFNTDYGAMLVDADAEFATMRFVLPGGHVMDTFGLPARGVDFAEIACVPAGATWKYLDDGSNQGVTWRRKGFDDSSWASGPAQLGYGEGDEATVVSYGPNPNNRYITSYYRREFQIADPAAFRSLALEIQRDDGAVVYVNGHEVFRSNMPGIAIDYLTRASSNLGAPDENAFTSCDLAPSVLVAGTNVIAVELHQFNQISSDASFDLRLTGYVHGTPLSPKGATWKYRDTGVEPGARWKLSSYDDSSWSSGPAQLGYGDGDEATTVGFGPDPGNRYVTTWFRRSFQASDPSAFRALLLRTLRDDGIVVYLNGTEVYRANLPYPGLTSASFAAHDVSGADESAFVDTFIDPRALVAGTNVLAVEVHQSDVASDDLSFDLELSGL